MVDIRRVSVVLPAYNAARDIEDQFRALHAQSCGPGWELVVADNGSTDSTAEVVRRWEDRFPRLRVVDASDRRGPGHARNVGAAAAEGEYLAFCDADDVVDPRWLEELVAGLEAADLVGGSLDHTLLNPAAVSDWRGATGQAGSPSPLGFLPYVLSGNMAVRRHAWQSLGGFRTDYEHCEDVELSWRAQLAGYRLGHAPAAVVHYRHRDSLPGLARQVYGYARAEARLYRDYRSEGARRRNAGQLAGAYLYVVTRLPFLAMSRRRRGFWLIRASESCGKVAGSLRMRVLCP